MIPTASTRVAAGAAWLDENGPDNWRVLVNPDWLNIASNRDCVLGQLFGSYIQAVQKFPELEENLVRRIELGFTDTDRNAERELTEAWKLELAA